MGRPSKKLTLQYEASDSYHYMDVSAEHAAAVPVALALASLRARTDALNEIVRSLQSGLLPRYIDPGECTEVIADIIAAYSDSLEAHTLAVLEKLFPSDDESDSDEDPVFNI